MTMSRMTLLEMFMTDEQIDSMTLSWKDDLVLGVEGEIGMGKTTSDQQQSVMKPGIKFP